MSSNDMVGHTQGLGDPPSPLRSVVYHPQRSSAVGAGGAAESHRDEAIAQLKAASDSLYNTSDPQSSSSIAGSYFNQSSTVHGSYGPNTPTNKLNGRLGKVLNQEAQNNGVQQSWLSPISAHLMD